MTMTLVWQQQCVGKNRTGYQCGIFGWVEGARDLFRCPSHRLPS